MITHLAEFRHWDDEPKGYARVRLDDDSKPAEIVFWRGWTLRLRRGAAVRVQVDGRVQVALVYVHMTASVVTAEDEVEGVERA